MTPQQVEAELRKRLEAVVKAAEAALYQGANIIMTEAKGRAPLDIGTLRNSGYVTLPRRQGDEVMVEAGFGGAAKAYAVAIHEGFYKRSDGRIVYLEPIDIGEKKYLENAINAKESEVKERIKRIAGKALENGIVQGTGPSVYPEQPSEEKLPGKSTKKRRKRGKT